MEAISKVDGLSIEDNPRLWYFIVKSGGKTVGCVNGKNVFRIDPPKRHAKAVHVTKLTEVPKAVAFLLSFVQQPKAQAATATKPPSKPKATTMVKAKATSKRKAAPKAKA